MKLTNLLIRTNYQNSIIIFNQSTISNQSNYINNNLNNNKPTKCYICNRSYFADQCKNNQIQSQNTIIVELE